MCRQTRKNLQHINKIAIIEISFAAYLINKVIAGHKHGS
jgi:hypothetical protein